MTAPLLPDARPEPFIVAGFAFESIDEAEAALRSIENAAWRIERLFGSYCCHELRLSSARYFFEHLYSPVGVTIGFHEKEIQRAAIAERRSGTAWMTALDDDSLMFDGHPQVGRQRRVLALAFCATILADALGEEYDNPEPPTRLFDGRA